jgi:hypothetical protein
MLYLSIEKQTNFKLYAGILSMGFIFIFRPLSYTLKSLSRKLVENEFSVPVNMWSEDLQL